MSELLPKWAQEINALKAIREQERAYKRVYGFQKQTVRIELEGQLVPVPLLTAKWLQDNSQE